MGAREKNQYMQEWNLAIQHQFSPKISLEAAYVGNKTLHVAGTYNINDPAPGPGNVRSTFLAWGDTVIVLCVWKVSIDTRYI